MKQFADRYRSCNVVVTGHTGFKGSWLCYWLNRLGANITGISLPDDNNTMHWSSLGLSITEHLIDIRETNLLEKTIQNAQPDIVFHLAAQPLVRKSYADPVDTWSTNVMGTVNLLDTCRKTRSIQAIIVITTDKCYENKEWERAYRETDRLGGHDPYSASKAATELAASSFRDSYFTSPGSPLLATARAGNVIGGGDWSEDRLIPDAARAVQQTQTLEIRYPEATRPWQHVLESICGYLQLGQKLLEHKPEFASAWNFGPPDTHNRSVAELLNSLKNHWPELDWQSSSQEHLHEAGMLHLDSTRARNQLGWEPVWDWQDTIRHTAEWYYAFLQNQTSLSEQQLSLYISMAQSQNKKWLQS